MKFTQFVAASSMAAIAHASPTEIVSNSLHKRADATFVVWDVPDCTGAGVTLELSVGQIDNFTFIQWSIKLLSIDADDEVLVWSGADGTGTVVLELGAGNVEECYTVPDGLSVGVYPLA
ncbi:hypothetical protein F5Y16DRAFT_420198 [Xylariaceae sp. FL0255]|nr:hypothetical protein F5Y16DRAFT_420198 [Xylariaceae sp. FL0255]